MINTSLHLYKNRFKLQKSLKNINPKDLIIKVKSCGICGSDLKIVKNGSPRVVGGRVIGHEIAGEIYNLNNNKLINTGKKILLGADIPNKKNKDFALGHEIDGGFQEYLILNQKLLKKIPKFITKKKINFDTAALCEPLACCINGLKKMDFKANKKVLIFGAGTIGNLISSLCILRKSTEVVLVDNNLNKLKVGIRNKILKKTNLKNFLKNKNYYNYFDYGFVACNSAKAQNQILNYIKNSGCVNLFSGIKNKTNKSQEVKINTNLIHYKELKVVGSHGSKKNDIVNAAKLIINKKIKLNGIITHKYNLKNFSLAFQTANNGSGLKVIINP